MADVIRTDTQEQLLAALKQGLIVMDDAGGCYIGFVDFGKVLLYTNPCGGIQHRPMHMITNFPMAAKQEKVRHG